ncbi:MAG: RNA-binding protein [Flammeovirgaceae bacterium]|nr:RNA-binding protein [Flammeovirgaceae bacterium]
MSNPRLIFFKLFPIILLVLCILSCQPEKDKPFKLLTATETGLTFNNEMQELIGDSLDALTFPYVYNGAGVATGDFNNDGLLDLFFAGNLVSSKLYLNQGSLQFNDVTEESKIATTRWCTGVSAVDINNDQLLDIYICVAGPNSDKRNYFFINQGLDDNGIPTFADKAREYGLDDNGYSTMAAFFDYDKDNDLDMYLLTNEMSEPGSYNIVRPKETNGYAGNNDRLYRNDGNDHFTNVNQETGILIEGWGLGVNISDINQDGWPDVYVSNDFISNDLLWINQQDGTFKNEAAKYLRHQTFNGMGNDVADINNDMKPDVIVVDMLPEDHYREKTMIGNNNYDQYLLTKISGYEEQYVRNTLQLNRGNNPDGSIDFSEISFFSGISSTDWSWAPLFADFDNDGWKDLFISNGYRKDVTNLDYITYSKNFGDQSYFGSQTKYQASEDYDMKDLESVPEVKIHNYMYHNQRDLKFKDMSAEWGLETATFSHGAIYADLDNDGDLDLVTNNMDQPAMLWENNINIQRGNNFLRIHFDNGLPIPAIGTKVYLYTTNNSQYLEYNPYRGFKSTVEPFLHFGLDSISQTVSIVIKWPNDSTTMIPSSEVNQVLSASELYQLRSKTVNTTDDVNIEPYFVQDTNYKQLTQTKLKEYNHNDFKETPALIHLLSKFGPYGATGDINGDGLTDLIVGGEINDPSLLWIQQTNGDFEKSILPGDSTYEDREIALIDIENDGDLDIYIVSGGSLWPVNHPYYRDRIYLNDGQGHFELNIDLTPSLFESGSTVKPFDIDNDGDLDLFVGSYLTPKQYPLPPNSRILLNDNGKFIDATAKYAPNLIELGMVTDATWTDINKDGHSDLVIVGEWMPITLFENDGSGNLSNKTEEYGLNNTNGWYRSIHASDLDNDGFVDLIAGNEGLNSYYKCSEQQPIEVFAKDFDNNGSVDPLITQYYGPDKHLTIFRDQIIQQSVASKRKFKFYDTFGKTTFHEAYSAKELDGAYHRQVSNLASLILKNDGGNTFVIQELPKEAQLAPINAINTTDVNNDGFPDMLIAGNSNAQESSRGNYDASYGLLLIYQPQTSLYEAIGSGESGIHLTGTVQQLLPISETSILVLKNDDYPEVIRVSK